jgi:glutamate carboxypeptidase
MTGTIPLGLADRVVDVDDVRRMEQWMRTHQDNVVADLFDFVSIETPSDDKVLLDRGLSWIDRWVGTHLPIPQDRRTFDGGDCGDVLALTFEGVGEASVTLLSHYDTVWGAGTISGWPVERNGHRASGPGIYDMKTGLVQSLWTIRGMAELGIARPTVHMLFTGDEEIGSPHSRPVIEAYSKKSTAVIVFEASEQSSIKTARKGIGRFTVTVTGREAHAGADFSSGISAIEELAHIVLRLAQLTDVEAGTTVNVGVIQGGTRSNVVAGYARAEVDVRFTKNSEVARVADALAVLETTRATVTVDGEWNRPAMERSPLTTSMYGLAKAAARALGVDLGEISVGGGSDGNFAAALGVPVLDGMGAVGAGPHARSEHVLLDRIPERAAIAAGVISAFAGGESR